jgi:hypothetical protein
MTVLMPDKCAAMSCLIQGLESLRQVQEQHDGGSGNHWPKVLLIGTKSNHDGDVWRV